MPRRKQEEPKEELRLALLAREEANRRIALAKEKIEEKEKNEAIKAVRKLYKKYKTYDLEEIKKRIYEEIKKDLKQINNRKKLRKRKLNQIKIRNEGNVHKPQKY